MAANAARRSIVRRATAARAAGRCFQRLAAESGIATPTAEDLVRLDRRREGKRLSNRDRTSPADPEAKIAGLKGGRTRPAYKPEHAVDPEAGAIIAAAIHPADRGDAATPPGTLEAAEANPATVAAAPTPEDPAELIADEGYHSRGRAAGPGRRGARKSRIAEPRVPRAFPRWHGDGEARRAVYANRARLRLGRGRGGVRAQAGPRSRASAASAPILDRGGLRRARLRGRAAARTCTSATSCTLPATIPG